MPKNIFGRYSSTDYNVLKKQREVLKADVAYLLGIIRDKNSDYLKEISKLKSEIESLFFIEK